MLQAADKEDGGGGLGERHQQNDPEAGPERRACRKCRLRQDRIARPPVNEHNTGKNGGGKRQKDSHQPGALAAVPDSEIRSDAEPGGNQPDIEWTARSVFACVARGNDEEHQQ